MGEKRKLNKKGSQGNNANKKENISDWVNSPEGKKQLQETKENVQRLMEQFESACQVDPKNFRKKIV